MSVCFKKQIFYSLIILFFSLLFLAFASCSKKAVLTVENLTVEFDGMQKGIYATLSENGSIQYNYVGIDNNYNSNEAPVQSGEYNVTVVGSGQWGSVEKTVTLSIVLPYDVDETGTILSNYKGSQAEIVLPSLYKNKKLQGLANNTFSQKNIDVVKVPEGEFVINPKAFDNSGLSKLLISENTTIKEGCFTDNIAVEFYGTEQTLSNNAIGNVCGIRELVLNESVVKIEENALSQVVTDKLVICSNLPLKGLNYSNAIRKVKVVPAKNNPVKMGVVADGFFENCLGVEQIEIDDGMMVLGDRVFLGCKDLKKLIVNANPYEAGENCFNDDFVLEELVVNAEFNFSLLQLNTVNTVLVNDCLVLPTGAFRDCKAMKKIILPNGLKEIGAYAFEKCYNLTEINIPETVEEISNYAFNNCTSLKNITIPNTVKSILGGIFVECTNLETVVLPSEMEIIPEYMFMGCNSLKNIEIPSAVKEIGCYAFKSCNSISEITLPNSVTKIHGKAFREMNGIRKVVLPENVSFLGDDVFGMCQNLREIHVTNNQFITYEGNPFANLLYCEIYVKQGLLEQYVSAFANNSFIALQ